MHALSIWGNVTMPVPDHTAAKAIVITAFKVEAFVRGSREDGYQGWLTLEPPVTDERAIKFYQKEIP